MDVNTEWGLGSAKQGLGWKNWKTKFYSVARDELINYSIYPSHPRLAVFPFDSFSSHFS